MRRNYQKELEQTIKGMPAAEKVPRLLLHSCCAPCSSYVLEYLSGYFAVTVFYYNPNITDEEEYQRRVKEQKRLIEQLPVRHPVSLIEGAYEPERFHAAVRGLEQLPEGKERCRQCFRLRLEQTAGFAAKEGYDYFTTTLTISPLKNADMLNEIGEQAAKRYGSVFLNSDFKKKGGYQRSLELSKIYDLYRQDYCGCVYSRRERMQRKEKAAHAPEGSG